MDRRELTGARSLQTAWSALALLAFSVVGLIRPALLEVVPLGVGTVGWVLGLALLGLRDRRAWTRLAAHSPFDAGSGAGFADFHCKLKGRSVTVAADLPSPLSQNHAVVTTTIDGAVGDARVELERVGEGATGTGVRVGNPALDGAWVIEGPASRVEALLSPDVQAALMDVTVPVTVDVTAGDVTARVPFTRLRPAELDTLATAVATIADRVERLHPAGRSRRA